MLFGGGSGIQTYSSIVSKYTTTSWTKVNSVFTPPKSGAYGSTIPGYTTHTWKAVYNDLTVTGTGMILLYPGPIAQLNIDGLGFFTAAYDKYGGDGFGITLPFSKSIILRSHYSVSNRETIDEGSNTSSNPINKPAIQNNVMATFFLI